MIRPICAGGVNGVGTRARLHDSLPDTVSVGLQAAYHASVELL